MLEQYKNFAKDKDNYIRQDLQKKNNLNKKLNNKNQDRKLKKWEMIT